MEESAFVERIVPLRRKVMAASLNAGATRNEAEDIAQDVLLRFWQMRNELSSVRSLDALAARMARNMTLNMHRRRPHLSLDESKAPLQIVTTATPSRLLEEKEATEWLYRKLDELPATEHSILYMRQVERLSGRDIARILGIEDSSVSTLLARARRKMLQEIERRNRK